MEAIVIRQGEGKFINLGPSQFRVKEEGSQTRQTLSILEITVAPNTQLPPAHIHRACEEIFYVLEGELEFFVNGGSVSIIAGDTLTVPIGVAHTYRNATDQKARMLLIYTEGRMANFFVEAESLIKSGVPAPQAIGQLLPKYDTDPVLAR
jgi:mannose-6-phosphate isomerase-like protein (cupin superfamily)